MTEPHKRFCVDCVHHILAEEKVYDPEFGEAHTVQNYRCRHPHIAVDRVSGQPWRRLCEEARRWPNDLCGTWGKLFTEAR